MPTSEGHGGRGDSVDSGSRTERLTVDIAANADTERLEIAIHRAVNGARERNGVDGLRMNDDYRDAAQAHSRDMAHHDYFSHEGPEGQNFKPNRCDPWGENIQRLRGYEGTPEEFAQRVVAGWLSSSEHRQNLLDDRFNADGIGVAIDRESGWVYVTQTLCG